MDSNQTKKNSKTLAYKEQKKIEPYTIDIHITSAILLALYDFQPKYYNLFFMENGNYQKKSTQRIFQSKTQKRLNIAEKMAEKKNEKNKTLDEKTIKWYFI